MFDLWEIQFTNSTMKARVSPKTFFIYKLLFTEVTFKFAFNKFAFSNLLRIFNKMTWGCCLTIDCFLNRTIAIRNAWRKFWILRVFIWKRGVKIGTFVNIVNFAGIICCILTLVVFKIIGPRKSIFTSSTVKARVSPKTFFRCPFLILTL